MTPEAYWAKLKALGLTPTAKYPVFCDRAGMHHYIPAPEEMDEEERADFVQHLMVRLGFNEH